MEDFDGFADIEQDKTPKRIKFGLGTSLALVFLTLALVGVITLICFGYILLILGVVAILFFIGLLIADT